MSRIRVGPTLLTALGLGLGFMIKVNFPPSVLHLFHIAISQLSFATIAPLDDYLIRATKL